MRDIIEISKGVSELLIFLKATDYKPDEQIAVLQAAAETVRVVVLAECATISMQRTFFGTEEGKND